MKLILGDCLEKMKELKESSVDSIVTDPPYGLSFMGKEWDHGIPGQHFWEEALRVAKPGAHILAFGGTRTYHRLACAIEDAGWEIRDCIAWVYGQGFPKSHNLDGEWKGWGTALKPAYEPIILARKPIEESTVAGNVLKYGTGGINIDGCRIETQESLAGGSGRIGGFAGKEQGGEISDYRVEGNSLGRWPANFIHDGSEEVLGLFPETTSGKPGIRRKPHETNAMGKLNLTGKVETGIGDSGSAARFFYCAKASRADRNNGCDGIPQKQMDKNAKFHKCRKCGKWRMMAHKELCTCETPEWYFPINEYRNNHPTVKPTSLMQYLCRLITPKGGIVLDPFMGSGSTGKAAILEGFDFIGIEKEEEYLEIAKARIDHTMNSIRKDKLI